MAIRDLEISETQVNQKGVVSAPDKLAGNATENKAVFDRLSKEAVVPNFNSLIEDLTGPGGAGNIGAGVTGLAGSNVQALLTNLKKHTDDTVTSIGAMSSFNGRNGAVVPKEGDYNADMIAETDRQFATRAEKAGWNGIATHVEDTEVHITAEERSGWNGTTASLVTHTTKTGIHHLLSEIMLAVHPVGEIYMSANTISPATLFGGTWIAWGQGRVPLGVGSIQANTTNTYGSVSAGSVNRTSSNELGGESTHKLTVAEMPTHAHTYVLNTARASVHDVQNGSSYGDYTAPTGEAGGDIAHNNLQPYITCYMWKRTA